MAGMVYHTCHANVIPTIDAWYGRYYISIAGMVGMVGITLVMHLQGINIMA